jgi:hypothetical protein
MSHLDYSFLHVPVHDTLKQLSIGNTSPSTIRPSEITRSTQSAHQQGAKLRFRDQVNVQRATERVMISRGKKKSFVSELRIKDKFWPSLAIKI